MMIATSAGAIAISLLDENLSGALTWVWIITGGWIGVRAVFGIVRVWPGTGNSPFDKLTCNYL
jgi:MATE family multidrug resistance protein